jgi:hypothetical protein
VEIILTALGAVLTLLIFSYLLGDNPLFRLALYIFVGASVAYILLVVLYAVFIPLLVLPDAIDSDQGVQWIISLIGVLLGVLLFARRIRWISWLSSVSVAVLIGVGVGVALGGALLGTLATQVDAATNAVIPEPPIFPEILQPLGQVLAFIGTVTGLMVFSFTSRRPLRRLPDRLLNAGAGIGRWFILIGFGAVFGGVLAAGVAFFADRVQYFVEALERIVGG